MGLLVGFSARLFAGDFVAPSEGPLAFRRDQVPLEVAMMNRLSQGFSILADESATKTAVDRRGIAQMLALAVALDPSNTKARSLIEEFASGKHTLASGVDAGQIESYRTGIWQSIEWLETAEARGQGLALAACLKDMVIFFDSKDPRALVFREAGERGAWAGWIPPLAAYEMNEIPITQEILPKEQSFPKPPLTAATLATLGWGLDSNSDKERWMLNRILIKMSAVSEDADGVSPHPFKLVIGSPAAATASSGLVTQILQLLKKQHRELPPGVQVTLNGDRLDELIYSKKSQSISGALAVLASAAATGRELGNVIIIGKVDDKGSFTLPTDFWAQLQSLGPSNGGRLVLPAAAVDYLPSMLVLERQTFFMDHEVLLAANFEELLDLTAKTPDAALAHAFEQFHEICIKGKSQSLGQYVANLFVRRRLAEIYKEAPCHYSAKMLGIQGAGSRATTIGRKVLVAELRQAIEPMKWIVNNSVDEFENEQTGQLGFIYETCRVRLDELARKADKNDRNLVSKVQDMIAGIRILDRAAKSRGGPHEVLEAMNLAQKNLMRIHAGVMDELSGENNEKESMSPR